MSAKWPSAVATDADLYTAVNLLQTTLSGTITNSVTTITLASTTGFPTTGAVTIENEVIFYTGVSGASLTGCTRGADGTSAASHNSGLPVGATIVAFHHNALMAEIEAIETDLHTRFGYGSSLILIQAGAANAPSLAFQGDATKGFYDQGTNAIGVALSGVDAYNFLPASFRPAGDNTQDLGAAAGSAQWRNFYVGTQIINSATSNQLKFGGTNNTVVSFTAPSASRVYTFPDAGSDANVVMDKGNYTVAGTIIFSHAGTRIAGVTDASAASAGDVGEVIEAHLLLASATTLTTNTPINVASISLTAGDWDIQIQGGFNIVSGTPAATSLKIAVSTTSATFPATSTFAAPDSNGQVTSSRNNAFPSASDDPEVVTAYSHVSRSSTVTYYLVAQATFAAGSVNSWGSIIARRRR